MKRVVKNIKQRKNGKVYSQAWIGYNYRNKNGTPDFKREVSLNGLTQDEIEKIKLALRLDIDDISPKNSQVEFLGGHHIGGFWTAYCIAESLGIIQELQLLDEKYQYPILCMILDRVMESLPHSKRSLSKYLPGSALERVAKSGGSLGIKLQDIYKSLEVISKHQDEIQKSLFKVRETNDPMYLYDITSSYFEGTQCLLSDFGYNRDGKKGKMQIVIGLLTDSDGRPIAIEVFQGNTQDQSTVMKKIDQMAKDFGISEMIFIGDRGMVTKARREDLEAEEYDKVKYISALTRNEFFNFIEDQDHPIQLTLFDRSKLVEVEKDGARYVLSFNPEKEQEDRDTRLKLLDKTEEKLKMIARNVKNGRIKKQQVIAKKIHTWINNWKMEKFFIYGYEEGKFEYKRNEEKILQYEGIDGFYVLTTDVADNTLDTEEVRRRYKSLSKVEQAFRAMKTTDLFIRPIRHWNAERVKGHVFVCMLSYLITWKARKLFDKYISENEDDDSEDGDSQALRNVWEFLAKEVQVGEIKIDNRSKQYLKPISSKAKEMLKAAGATIGKKQKLYLRLSDL